MKNYIQIKGTDIKLALSDSEAFPIEKNFSASNISDFERGEKKDFSKEIRAKGHRVLDEYFLQVNTLGDVEDWQGVRETEVDLYINYMHVFSGVMLIRNVEIRKHYNTYSLYLFSGEIGMLNGADSYKLSALDFSDLPTLEFGASGVFSNWNTSSSDVRLCVVDKGIQTYNPRDFDYHSIQPFFKVYYIVRKIGELLGLNFHLDFLEGTDFSDDLNKMIIGRGAKSGLALDNAQIIASTGEVAGEFEIINYATSAVNVATDSLLRVLNTNKTAHLNINNILIPNPAIVGNVINLPYSGLINIELTGTLKITLGADIASYWQSFNELNKAYIHVRVGGVTSAIIECNALTTTGSNTLECTFNKSAQFEVLETDMQIWFSVGLKHPSSSDNTAYFGTVQPADNIEVETTIDSFLFQQGSEELEFGMDYNWNAEVPDMSCGEFLRNMIKMLGVSWYRTGDDVYFYLYRNFYKSNMQAKDWNGKEDNESPITYSILQNEQAKDIYFKFADSGDLDQSIYKNKTGKEFGAGLKVNASKFARAKEEIAIDFSPVALVKYPAVSDYSDLYLPRFINDKGERNEGGIRIGFEKRLEVTGGDKLLRLVDIGGINPGVEHSLIYTVAEFSDTFYCLFSQPKILFHDLDIPIQTLYNFHQDRTDSFISENARMVEANFRIKEDEFNMLVPNDLIKWRGYYWRIVTISDVDYSKSATIKVTLIKQLKARLFSISDAPSLPPIIPSPELLPGNNTSIIEFPDEAVTETTYTFDLINSNITNIAIFAEVDNAGFVQDITAMSDIVVNNNILTIKVNLATGEQKDLNGYISITYR